MMMRRFHIVGAIDQDNGLHKDTLGTKHTQGWNDMWPLPVCIIPVKMAQMLLVRWLFLFLDFICANFPHRKGCHVTILHTRSSWFSLGFLLLYKPCTIVSPLQNKLRAEKCCMCLSRTCQTDLTCGTGLTFACVGSSILSISFTFSPQLRVQTADMLTLYSVID